MARGGAILLLLLGVHTSVSNLVKIDKKCDRESDDTDRQTQTGFINCPMLYAIAWGTGADNNTWAANWPLRRLRLLMDGLRK